MSNPSRLYYWNERPNLGDVLNRLLWPDAEWSPVAQSDWVGIGSLVELFDGFTGTVFGTGRAGPSAPPTDLTRANVVALRGHLTRELVKTKDEPLFGDPGWLVADQIPGGGGTYTAIVPHYSDRGRMRDTYPTARFVDVTGDPEKALRAIAGAERVISSSLHGIVLADAWGIPRMWDWFPGVQAKGFKFKDYGSVVGYFEPGEWKQVDVSRRMKELRSCL